MKSPYRHRNAAHEHSKPSTPTRSPALPGKGHVCVALPTTLLH